MLIFCLVVILLFISSLNAQVIKCLNNCEFNGKYKFLGFITRTLLDNQLCYNDKIFDFTITGLEECAGTPIPTDNKYYCQNDGEQFCEKDCNCEGTYYLCQGHIKRITANLGFVCVQNNTNNFNVSTFHPRCSESAIASCGDTCTCTQCLPGMVRLENLNHCGAGYYKCNNQRAWEYFPVNETTICSVVNGAADCKNEPYCQVSPTNCYNNLLNELVCELPEDNTCVEQCEAGKGYWSCSNGECVEKQFDGTVPTETACYNGPNGAEVVDLTFYNNICKCPNTDCTTTESTTESTAESTTLTTTESTTETTTDSTTGSTTVTTTGTTTEKTSFTCPSFPPHPPHPPHHPDDDDNDDNDDDDDNNCDCKHDHHCRRRCCRHHGHCKPKRKRLSLCPRRNGRFCLQEYRRGVGYLICENNRPDHIMVEYTQYCKQITPTQIIIQDSQIRS